QKHKQQTNQPQMMMMMRWTTKSLKSAENEKEDQVYWDRSVSSENLWIHETRLGKNKNTNKAQQQQRQQKHKHHQRRVPK
ncbi:hypothetical protein ACXO1I_09625, partial [Lactobacillus delbrueckii subsp. bulgaricus]|nr:hypothetical protein [Lactobacillus delbrueckii subsp. bulgaricus]